MVKSVAFNDVDNLMLAGLDLAENFREKISLDSSKHHKEALGQYLTPAVLANFAVKFFDVSKFSDIKLLDPGAGAGSLTCSFLENFYSENWLCCTNLLKADFTKSYQIQGTTWV